MNRVIVVIGLQDEVFEAEKTYSRRTRGPR
jgi:hypothetical protein